MIGPDVYWVKTTLAKLALSPLDDSTWEFDTQLEAAVLRFQRLNNLITDGVVGPSTFRALWATAISLSHSQGLESKATDYPNVLLHVDGGRCLLHYFLNGHLEESYPIALGSPNALTPCGYWQVMSKEVDPGGFFGSRWLGLSIPFGAYGIHGTNNSDAIGKRVTHGCIYLLNSHIEALYPHVPLNTPVLVTGPAATGRMLQPGVLPGRDIQRVQSILQTLRLFEQHPDGRYTAATAVAVFAFQELEGLEPSGNVCPYTSEFLEKAYDIACGSIRP